MAKSSDNYYPSFDGGSDTLYYIWDNSTWEIFDGKWNGYNAKEWYPEHPDAIAMGYCGGEGDGTNLIWKLSNEGVLTISGTGTMANYRGNYGLSTTPWGTYASSMKTLVLEYGVTTIGDYAFYCCSGFTGNLVIPDSVATIGESAFMHCSGFTGNLTIGNSVTTIRNYAFYKCTGFTGNLVMPDSVTTIWDYAFISCGINDYYFKGDEPFVCSAPSICFSFDSSSDTIYYPSGNSTWSVSGGKWLGYTAESWNPGSSGEIVYGDADGDGRVTVKDAYAVRLIAAKLIVPTEEQKEYCDVDLDGKITAIDANIIRKFVVKIITERPVGM